jgi:hypothetical protein
MEIFKISLSYYLKANDGQIPTHALEYRIKDLVYVGFAKEFCDYIYTDSNGEKICIDGIMVELPYRDNAEMVFPIYDTIIHLPINFLKEKNYESIK